MLKPKILQGVREKKLARTRRQKRARTAPRWRYPERIAKSYSIVCVDLMEFVIKTADADLVSRYPDLILLAAAQRSWQQQMQAAEDRVWIDLLKPGTGLHENEIYDTALEIGRQVEDFNDKEWRNVMRKVVGVELFQSEPWLAEELKTFAWQNKNLIVSLRDESVNRIARMTIQCLQQGKRHEVYAEEIMKLYGNTRNRAKVIARDQISKLNGNLTRLRQTNAEVKEYIWRTAGDERVRPSHRAKNGEKFAWADPPGDTGHPGEDYMCRCTAEAVFPPEILEGVR